MLMKNHTISASGVIERFAADCAWASARLHRKPLERQQWVAGVANLGFEEAVGRRASHTSRSARSARSNAKLMRQTALFT